jgi:hypothetical protein
MASSTGWVSLRLRRRHRREGPGSQLGRLPDDGGRYGRVHGRRAGRWWAAPSADTEDEAFWTGFFPSLRSRASLAGCLRGRTTGGLIGVGRPAGGIAWSDLFRRRRAQRDKDDPVADGGRGVRAALSITGGPASAQIVTMEFGPIEIIQRVGQLHVEIGPGEIIQEGFGVGPSSPHPGLRLPPTAPDPAGPSPG